MYLIRKQRSVLKGNMLARSFGELDRQASNWSSWVHIPLSHCNSPDKSY